MSGGGRALDVALGSVGVLLFGPPVAMIALAIRAEDGGPSFFRQERIGRDRRPFTVLKLRSMRDGQVTRIGRWIRATGLDETTQFLNVLRGQMSVVGPRPLTAADVDRVGWGGPAHDARFALPPGITGLAQLFASPGAASSRALDEAYARDRSAWLDLQVVAASFVVNLVGKSRVKRWLRGHRYAAGGAEHGVGAGGG
ncbi:MAG: sugar transferase [Proteobacteria bacterium]|nr:sugar transferase [Pseudomonadota bacterium]